ncbi:MAG: ABC transporter ATP-binding protein [Alphaproteobacteria bacterium]|nr:ABC transporter ATP-binding protein [Alphaproteobacteria bacterium]
MSATDLEIVFDRVNKSFERPGGSAFEAVRDLSFTVARGDLVAVLGKTGCGKSTMFNLLAGLIQPSAGTVRVQGRNPYRDFDWFRSKVGIVFQNDRLMPWRSALENIALGLEINKMPRAEREAIAARWLDRLGLSGHAQDYPHALSGGMRQRVSIARAFAVKPDILLADEPFSALDEVTGNALRAEFLDLVRDTGATSIFITHSIDEALQLGRRILVFRRPARLVYTAAGGNDVASAARAKIRAEILRALADEALEERETIP